MTILVGKWEWDIKMVPSYDDRLIDRTGTRTLGTTDIRYRTVYLDETLRGELLRKVFLHEIGHCIMVSYGYLKYLHKVVKEEYWEDAEERLCNFLANHSLEALQLYEKFNNEGVYDW